MNRKPSQLYKKAKKCVEQNDREKAIEHYQKIIEILTQEKKGIEPKYYLELGKLYQQENNFKEAVIQFVNYIDLNPKDGVILNEIGICYFHLENFKDAVVYFEKVIKMAQIPDVYNNIANCYRYLKKYFLCEKMLIKSYELQPNHDKTKYSFTEIYYILKEYKKGIYYYLLVNDKDSKHSYNVSFCYLSLKNFRLGFELYENRLKYNEINNQTKLVERVEIPEIPYWDGTTECNHLLIIYEQGFGDNIQYFRFIIELSEKFPIMRISYFCSKTISKLFNVSNYPNITVVTNMLSNIFTKYDYKIYSMSLPYKLGITKIQSNSIHYIETNPDKLLHWKEKFGSLKKFKIGFVYNGLLNSYLEKYIPLEEFKTLLDLDVELICIQRLSEIEKDVNNITWKDKIHYYDIDKEEPFIDTVAILQNIDLLISIDTYIVHLAGILGVKTLLLLGKISEWRWSTDDQSYWYDSVEILRVNEFVELKSIMPLVKRRVESLL